MDLVQVSVHALVFLQLLLEALELLVATLLVADGHDEVVDGRELVERQVEPASLLGDLLVEALGVLAAARHRVNAVDVDARLEQEPQLVAPVDLLLVVRVRRPVRDVVADHHQDLRLARGPLESARLVQHQLVALRGVPSARWFHLVDEGCNFLHVVRQIEGLGDVRTSSVAIVTVSDDSHPEPLNVSEKPLGGVFAVSPHLSETRIHRPRGVERQDHIDRGLAHADTPFLKGSVQAHGRDLRVRGGLGSGVGADVHARRMGSRGQLNGRRTRRIGVHTPRPQENI
jgi:hypothetical protein